MLSLNTPVKSLSVSEPVWKVSNYHVQGVFGWYQSRYPDPFLAHTEEWVWMTRLGWCIEISGEWIDAAFSTIFTISH